MIIKDINNDEARVSLEVRNTIQGEAEKSNPRFRPCG